MKIIYGGLALVAPCVLAGPYWPLFVTHHPPDPHVHAHHPHLCLSSHILAHTLVFVLASPPSPH